MGSGAERLAPEWVSDSEAQLREMIAGLDPLARTAAHGLARYLTEFPGTLESREELHGAFLGSVAFALRQTGRDTGDGRAVAEFVDLHGDAVSDAALWAVQHCILRRTRRRSWRFWQRAPRFDADAFLTSVFE